MTNNPERKSRKQGGRPSSFSTQGFDSLAQAYRKLAPYLNIGYVFAASIALLTWLGYVLDKKWGTSPWLTLTGALLGVATGFYNFFKTVFWLQKRNNEKGEDE